MKYNIAREKGLLLMRDGKFEEALQEFAKAEEGMPNFGILQYDMGVALDQLGRYAEAEKRYSRCIELEPDYERAYNNRAVVYARMQKFEEAIADCTRAIELNASDPLPYRNRGLSLFDLERHKEAIEDFNLSLRLSGDAPQTLLSRARAYIAINENDQALEDLSKVLDLDEQNANAYYLSGLALRHLNLIQDAERSFAQAIELDPSLEIPEQVEVIAAKPVSKEVDPTVFARVYLTEQGYENLIRTDSGVFALTGHKAGSEFRVLLKELNPASDLTLSADEVQAIQDHKVCLVVYTTSDKKLPRIVKHIEDWQPQSESLKPSQFHYSFEEK